MPYLLTIFQLQQPNIEILDNGRHHASARDAPGSEAAKEEISRPVLLQFK